MSAMASLLEANLNKRDNGLGDRSLYMGASETMACEEAMYYSKIKKIHKPRKLEEIIVLLKGNIGENLVEWGFGENVKYDSQVECHGTGEYSFITAHADFVVHFPNESVVVEVKTTNNVPETIRESWLRQTQIQMGFLGIKRAKVFAMNLNYGSYAEYDVEFNEVIFNATLKSMKKAWDNIHNNTFENIKGTKSPLCAYCQYNGMCKALKSDNVLPSEIEERIEEMKTHEKKAKELKENVQAWMEMTGYDRAKGKSYTIDISRRSTGTRLDYAKFKTKYPDVYKDCCYDAKKTSVMNIY